MDTTDELISPLRSLGRRTAALRAFPEEEENLLRLCSECSRRAAVRQHRGDHNRLGFAVQLCYLCYPGRVLAENETPPAALLGMVAAQLQVQPDLWGICLFCTVPSKGLDLNSRSKS
jgi:hypothetical protein